VSELLDKLNANVGKTPDEIVKAISKQGWVKLIEMTDAQRAYLDQQRCVVGADNGQAPEQFWIVAGQDYEWTFHADGWSTENGAYREFWFILHEEYFDGLVPDRFAERSQSSRARRNR